MRLEEIVDKLEELNEADREVLILLSGSQKECSLLHILHTQREEAVKALIKIVEIQAHKVP